MKKEPQNKNEYKSRAPASSNKIMETYSFIRAHSLCVQYQEIHQIKLFTMNNKRHDIRTYSLITNILCMLIYRSCNIKVLIYLNLLKPKSTGSTPYETHSFLHYLYYICVSVCVCAYVNCVCVRLFFLSRTRWMQQINRLNATCCQFSGSCCCSADIQMLNDA